jgi:hypothetical protein
LAILQVGGSGRIRSSFGGHARVDWIVYLKKPFGGPAQVLAYLGRYTHRVYVQAFDDFGVTVVMFHAGANDTFDAAAVLKKYGD